MDTREHTELGNAIQLNTWAALQDNPYLHFDKNHTLLIDVQGINSQGLPYSTQLNKTPAGVLVAMAGDYFGGKEVDFDLPSLQKFEETQAKISESHKKCRTLGHSLNQMPIEPAHTRTFLRAYKKLANPHVSREEFDLIYRIDQATYIPFSKPLNTYAQQLMFALRVKNYSEILTRNLAHFTPWAVRAYTVGHFSALNFARLSWELYTCALNPDYQPENQAVQKVLRLMEHQTGGLSQHNLQDMAYRYQALALGIEFFGFHYYTDHFAAGHGSFVGDLRAQLPLRFGMWGNLLVNSLHDELNQIGVYTTKRYDPSPDPTDAPIKATGDSDFDRDDNEANKQACLAGMKCSLDDLNTVFNGGNIPAQPQYGGFEHMPDVDRHYRQPQPLLLLDCNGNIYYRSTLSQIKMLSPSQLGSTLRNPERHGYTQLTSLWHAFILVLKLRLLSFFYAGKLQPLTEPEVKLIEQEERVRNPQRPPIVTFFPAKGALTEQVLPDSNRGRRQHGFFSAHPPLDTESEGRLDERNDKNCAQIINNTLSGIRAN